MDDLDSIFNMCRNLGHFPLGFINALLYLELHLGLLHRTKYLHSRRRCPACGRLNRVIEACHRHRRGVTEPRFGDALRRMVPPLEMILALNGQQRVAWDRLVPWGTYANRVPTARQHPTPQRYQLHPVKLLLPINEWRGLVF